MTADSAFNAPLKMNGKILFRVNLNRSISFCISVSYYSYPSLPLSQFVGLLQSQTNQTQFGLIPTLSSDLPANLAPSAQSLDPIQVVTVKNKTFVFMRSLTNTSQLYWNSFNGSLNFDHKKWKQLGDGGEYLTFDPYAAVNTFLGRVEVFGVFDSEHVMHTWQDGPDSFHTDWEKLGGLFSPKFNSVPVAYQMGHSDFNGVLNLFVRGTDGRMHHISQTTCDDVKNAWGPCTWTTFHTIGSTPPSDETLPNPFTASRSIHHGIEVRVRGVDPGLWASGGVV